MNLLPLAQSIRSFSYVVMRNWEKLPEFEDSDGDIDFFVLKEDVPAFEGVISQYLQPHQYDIRTNGDRYYTTQIENLLLYHVRSYGGFWVPSEEAHFLSLYYHNLVHKGDGRYDKKLKKIFLDWMQPQPPIDTGVGYHNAVD